MWRGLETILRGRDAREGWVFAQRFCGVCTTVHAIASVRAVEDALALDIPPNAQYIRNLILIGHALHDHIVHFYHLSALDWVDIMSIPKADPARAASIAEGSSDLARNSRRELEAVQDKVKGPRGQRAARHLLARLLGPSGHAPEPGAEPDSVLPLFAGARVPAEVLPGRGDPRRQDATHPESCRGRRHECDQPEQPGDHEHGSPGHVAIDSRRPDPFVQQVFLVDTCLLAASYPEWLHYGRGVANYLAVPDLPVDAKATKFDLPGGVIMNGNLASVRAHHELEGRGLSQGRHRGFHPRVVSRRRSA
jgi:hydrogenase large subunit